jgi:hypothetical protein
MGRRKSKGLGDSIETFTEVTGIKTAVKLFSEITGLDCGCDERKEKLNQLFPYKQINCLNENDYLYLKKFFEENTQQITPILQRELKSVYYNIFNVNLQDSSCSSCWRDTIEKLRKVYQEYEIVH